MILLLPSNDSKDVQSVSKYLARLASRGLTQYRNTKVQNVALAGVSGQNTQCVISQFGFSRYDGEPLRVSDMSYIFKKDETIPGRLT